MERNKRYRGDRHMSVPIGLFIGMGVVLFTLVAVSFLSTGIRAIFASMIAVIFAYVLSKISINRSLVQNIGGFDTNGSVVQASTSIEVPALSYLFVFVGLFMVVILVIHIMKEIKFRKSQDIVEIDI